MNPLQPHLSKAFSEEKIARAAFQAFLSITKKWQLNRKQQTTLLGQIPNSTYHLWKNKTEKREKFTIPKDTLERISYILGIYKALHILLPSEKAANSWIHKSNDAPLFNHQTALDKMLAGNVVDLADIRRYLDTERGM
ncbi:MAG: antitoxin Xre/MbcA/ParS toxin-binding domain-containing protein [Candidatus Berkiella sp.]